MTQRENTENKTRRRSPVGIIFLILLCFLIGTAGYVYYSLVKSPLILDDPQQMAASAPMDAAERFRVSSGEGTVQVKMEAADIWCLVLAQAGPDFLEDINEEVSPYGLSVSGCAIHIDEDGLRLDMECFFRDTRLAVKVLCDLQAGGQRMTLKPAALKLGVFSLPVGSLLPALKLEYDLMLPVISDVTHVGFQQDALVLTGTMDQDVHSLVPSEEKLHQSAIFSQSLQPLVDYLLNCTDYAALLSALEQNPADVETLYRELFVLAAPETVGEYLDSRSGLTQRFFPGIDFSDLQSAQAELNGQLASQFGDLTRFFTSLVHDYDDKKFTLSGGEFLRNNQPFRAAAYGQGAYDSLFEQLEADAFFLVLVDASNGFIRNTASFYRMADENQQFTQDVDYNKTYILGCVFRSVSGAPYLLYSEEVTQTNSYFRRIATQPLTEDEVSALRVPGKFGVWTD